MAKEQFFIAGSKDVLGYVDEAGRKAGVSRGQAFDDFLTFVRCALAGQTMEDEYLAAVRKGYDKGEQGKRGIDVVTKAFATLVNLMEETGQDVLGDVFQGGITYGEGGQYFAPEPITELMARLTALGEKGSERKSVCDPACGSGRNLLAVAKDHPHWEYTGQDVDHRCVQMTAINLGLRGLFGYVVWQNSLTLEVHRVYKIGFNLSGGVIRELASEHSPFDYNETKQDPSPTTDFRPVETTPSRPTAGRQLDLF